MCWQCDHPGSTTADYLEELRETIRKHKWAVQYAEGRPETVRVHDRAARMRILRILVTGVDPERALRLLNAVANYTVREVQPAPGDLMDLGGEVQLEFVRSTSLMRI